MKSSFFVTSLAAAVLFTPVLIWAQPPGPPPNRPNARRQSEGPPNQERARRPRAERPDIRAELGLTDDQVAQIRESRDAARRERLLKTTDLRIASMDIRSLLRAEKVDEKALAARLAQAQAAQGALLKIKVDSALAMKRILTPEQQKKMMEMRPPRGRARMGQRMRGPGTMGPGRGRMGEGMRRMPAGPGDEDPGEDEDLDLDPLDFGGGDGAVPMVRDLR